MTQREAEKLMRDHRDGGHEVFQLVCPACLSVDLAAARDAERESCAQAVEHVSKKCAAIIRARGTR